MTVSNFAGARGRQGQDVFDLERWSLEAQRLLIAVRVGFSPETVPVMSFRGWPLRHV